MTIDDRLLEQLGERARERADDELATESRRAADEAPPSAEFKRRVVTEILRRQREETETETDGPPEDQTADLDPRPVLRPLATPSRRPRPWLRSLAVAASVSLALGVAWWSRSPVSTDAARPPSFAVETLGVAAEMRGTPSPSTTDDEISTGRYRVGNQVELRLRPDTPIDDPVRATAWRRDGTAWHPWPVDIAVSDQGAVRLRTLAGDAALPIGEHTIRVDLTLGPAGEPGAVHSWLWRLRVEPMTDDVDTP